MFKVGSRVFSKKRERIGVASLAEGPRLIGYCLALLLFVVCVPVQGVAADDPDSVGETEQQSQQPAETSELGQEDQSETQEEPKRVPGAVLDFQELTTKPVSPSVALRSSFFKKSLSEWVGRFQPNQGGIVWLAFLLTILVAVDFKSPFSWRNGGLLLLLAPSILLVDLIRFDRSYADPIKLSLLGLAFLGIFLATIALLVRAIFGALKAEKRPWTPNLPSSALLALLVLLLACNTLLALSRAPDDCGIYTNWGAKRLLETGKFPYGDPALRGGAAATYGPILYVAHIPFQWVLSLADDSPEASGSAQGNVGGRDSKTTAPPVLPTKLTLLFFHFLGVAGLVIVGRQLVGPALGWSLACLYCASPYVQGLGGEQFFITGMTFISHIAPASVTILAFALLNRPFWAGSMLGVAAGVLFYPAFFVPVWLGYYFWQGKDWRKFAAGFLVVCAVIGFSVLLMTESSEGETNLAAIYESTVGHQESKAAYGSSTFGFWGTHPRMAAFWQQPLIPGWYLLKPSFLLFVVFLGASFFLARGRSVPQFAFLIAAVAISIQLWKSHAGGTYIEWYLPFFLIGLLGQQSSECRWEAGQTAKENDT